MKSKNLVVAVDLGDSNVVVAAGSLAPNGTLNMEGIVSKPSEGVEAGQIVNINEACHSISSAIQELEERLNIKIYEAYAGISGNFIHSTDHTDYVHVGSSAYGIKEEDVTALYERMCSARGAKTKVVMEYIPQRFVVDNKKVVEKPVGSFGDRLSATFNFILSEAEPINRLTLALKRLGIKLLKAYPNTTVIGDAVLSDNEKQEGVIVVDLGSELTDIAIYHNNVLRYTTTIPIGGNAINRDIRTMTIPKDEVERLKVNNGSALAEKVSKNSFKEIQGRTPREKQKVILYNLAIAIEARLTDIIRLINKEIINSGFAGKLSYGIVITGGLAQLRHIGLLFKQLTNLDVRIAEPDEVISDETNSLITSSSDTTVVGILLRALKDGYCKVEFLPDPEPEPEPEPEVEVVSQPEVEPELEPEPEPQQTYKPTPAVEPQEKITINEAARIKQEQVQKRLMQEQEEVRQREEARKEKERKEQEEREQKEREERERRERELKEKEEVVPPPTITNGLQDRPEEKDPTVGTAKKTTKWNNMLNSIKNGINAFQDKASDYNSKFSESDENEI